MDLFFKQCSDILGCLSKNLNTFLIKPQLHFPFRVSSRLLGKHHPPSSGQRWDRLEGITQFLSLVIGSQVGMWPNSG